jgi:hypothetical protein
MFRLALVLLAAFATHQATAAPCNPCGDAYTMTGSGGSFSDGAGGSLSCSKLVEFAADRQSHHDVCYIINNYARKNCGCVDGNGNPAPDLPYLSETAQCNFCGDNDGENGSDLWTIDPAKFETLVDTTIAVEETTYDGKCGLLWNILMEQAGYLTPSQCIIAQDAIRDQCGCALRDASGNKITRGTGGGGDPSPPMPASSNPPPPTASTISSPPPPSPTPAISNPSPDTCVKLNAVCTSTPCCSGFVCKHMAGTAFCDHDDRRRRHLRAGGGTNDETPV